MQVRGESGYMGAREEAVGMRKSGGMAGRVTKEGAWRGSVGGEKEGKTGMTGSRREGEGFRLEWEGMHGSVAAEDMHGSVRHIHEGRRKATGSLLPKALS